LRTLALIAALALLSNGPLAKAQAPATTNGQPPGVSIRFLGFTNSVPVGSPAIIRMNTNQFAIASFTQNMPGGPAAVFEFTNSSPYETAFAVQSMEYKTEGGWQSVPLPVNAQTMGFLGAEFPGQLNAVVQCYPVSDTNVAWRIKAFCVEKATGLPRAIECGGEIGHEVVTGQKTVHLSGRKYMVSSSDSSK
jgi:hypothetical protein